MDVDALIAWVGCMAFPWRRYLPSSPMKLDRYQPKKPEEREKRTNMNKNNNKMGSVGSAKVGMIAFAGSMGFLLPPGVVLQEEAGFLMCLEALGELRTCTSEIILFFLNGESFLGPDCCRAIRIVTRQCWPAQMLATLGFTSQESGILQRYCDATTASPPLPNSGAASLPVSGAPLVAVEP